MKEKLKNKGVSRKEIRSTIKDSLNAAIVQFEKEGTSKKVTKVVDKASKKIAGKIKKDLKKDLKKIKAKKIKPSKKMNGEVKGSVVA